MRALVDVVFVNYTVVGVAQMVVSVVYHGSIGCHRKHEVSQFIEVKLFPVVYILLSDLGLRRFFFSINFYLDNYFSFDWFEALKFDK